jgi:hypothetical protein
MNNEIRERYLKLALVVSGIAFLLIYPRLASCGLRAGSGMVARATTICR